MLAQSPLDMSKVPEKLLDLEILRLAMIAELDAVNLYEQLAAMTKSKHIKESPAGEPKTKSGFATETQRHREEQKRFCLLSSLCLCVSVVKSYSAPLAPAPASPLS